MRRYQYSQNEYPAINVSGNARAILGNVYRACEHSDNEGPSPLGTLIPRLKSSQYHVLEEETRSSAQFGKVVVALLEDYKCTKMTIQRVKGFHRKIQRCASHMSIRQGVFEQSLKNLIVLFTRSSENAHEMLVNADHPTWTQADFLEYLQDCSEAATEGLWETLGLITSDLEDLDSFAQKYVTLCTGDEAGLVMKPPDQARLSFQADLQQLLCRSRLEARLDSLKENTASLEKLVQQRLPSRVEPQSRTPTAQTKLKLGRYHRTQEAAGSLYRSLGMACIQHPIHQAQLRLRTESGSPSQVQFTMMLQHAEAMPSLGETCCLSLTIESQVMGTVVGLGVPEVSHSLGPIDKSSKRILHQSVQSDDMRSTVNHNCQDRTQTETKSETVIAAKSQKRLKTHTETKRGIRFACPQDIIPSSSVGFVEDWPNFCDRSNFCTHVQQVLTRGFIAGHPLGYLHTREDAKHLIYLSSQTHLVNTKPPTLTMESLKSLFASSELSTASIISLSKQLSIAVLQYNATPWLEQWDADHVLISCTGKTLAKLESGLLDSYLDVSISSLHQQASAGELRETFVPNMTLFRLGTMLLELAYQQPLRDMQEPSDQRPNEYDTAFATARRLRWRVSEKMGPEFADIVGKCIQCDFGHGQDLRSKLLQECYYENVVQGLENLQMRIEM